MKNKFLALGLIVVLTMSMGLFAFASAGNNIPANNIKQETKKTETEKENSEDLDLTNAKVDITENQAKLTAVQSVSNGIFVKIELEDENGSIVYGVEVNDGTNVHDVKVDANTGLVLKDDIGNDREDANKEDSDAENSEESTEDEAIVDTNVLLTEADATQIAMESVPNGTFVKIELEDENGTIIYSVEVNDGTAIHDLKVNASNGLVLKDEIGNGSEDANKEESDADEDNENGEESADDETIVDTNVVLTKVDAIQIATKSVDSAANFVKSELEDENGTIVYAVEFTLDKQEIDVKVDANKGSIIASDQETGKEDENSNDQDQVEHENDQGDEDGSED